MAWVLFNLLSCFLEVLADLVLTAGPWVLWTLLQISRVLLNLSGFLPIWMSIITFLCIILYVHHTRTFTTFQRLGIPGPPPLPFIGNLLPIIFKGVLRADRDNVTTYGKVVGTYEGHTPTLIVADLQMLRQIMVKQFHNFQNRRGGSLQGFPMRRALTSLRGGHWKHVRGLLSPTFSTSKIKNMIPLIDDCCKTLVTNLDEYDTDKVDLKRLFGAFTMDVIASTAFGLQIDSQKNADSAFVKYAKRVFNFRVRPVATILILLFGPISSWVVQKLKINFFPEDATEFFVNVVDDTMKSRLESNAIFPSHQVDFLKLMMDVEVENSDLETSDAEEIIRGPDGLWTKQGLTREEILAQSLLFFLAGYETTASTLSFVGYCLATNPQHQEQLLAEIDEVGLGKLDVETIAQMTFLDKVVCETLRLYPPAGRITRICCRNTSVEGITIEKGTVIVVPIYSLHHDSSLWPHPDKFDPNRFSAKEKSARDPISWMPFGMGPRQCIGMRLALLEIKMTLIHLLKEYSFQTCPQTKVPLRMKKRGLLQPEHPILVKLTRRTFSTDQVRSNTPTVDFAV